MENIETFIWHHFSHIIWTTTESINQHYTTNSVKYDSTTSKICHHINANYFYYDRALKVLKT